MGSLLKDEMIQYWTSEREQLKDWMLVFVLLLRSLLLSYLRSLHFEYRRSHR